MTPIPFMPFKRMVDAPPANFVAMPQDVQALWKEVFDQAHVVVNDVQSTQPPSQERPAQGPASAMPSASLLVSEPGREPAFEGHPFATDSNDPAPSVVSTQARADLKVTVLPPGPDRQPNGNGVPTPRGNDVMPVFRVARLQREFWCDEVRPALAETLDVPVDVPLPDEVVQVYRDGDALEVVIRDGRLQDDAAVRCAHAVAWQLGGNPRALRRVILNGRAVFDAVSLRIDSTPAVSFSG